METISSGLRAAASAMYSAAKAASKGAGNAANSTVSWLGRQVTWVASSLKSAASTVLASSRKTDFGVRQNLAAPNTSTAGTSSPITAKVTVESTLPPVTFREFACHEAVARALAKDHPSDGTLKNAITLFTLREDPAVKQDKELHDAYTKRAVALVKHAISKYPPEVQAKIKETLGHLEKEYDSWLEGAMESGTFNPAGIKAALSKISEEAFPSKLQQLKTKIVKLETNEDLASYKSHFNRAQKHLAKAEEFYRAGNFTLGDEQYAYAHRLADTPRYMELRTKLNITQAEKYIDSADIVGSEDVYKIGTQCLNQHQISDKLKAEPKNTSLKNYWSAVSSLRTASETDSVEKYESSIQDVKRYLQS